MRIPVLICAILGLAACGSRNAGNTTAIAEQNGAGEVTVTNDVTAIDAATGDSANMAADVNYTVNEANFESGNQTAASVAPPAPRRAPPPPAAKPVTVANTVANSVQPPAAGNTF